MKVARIYARVSKEEDDPKNIRFQDPENQLGPLREWAKTLAYDLVVEYVDRGSGADSNRKDFRRIQEEARAGDDILVWKLDRFTRETMSTAVGRVQGLRAKSIAIKSYTENWLDTSKDNPMSELVLAVMSWAAAEERRKISERTKAGIARRRAIGQWKGGRPHKLDDATVSRIADLRKQGIDYSDIAKTLGLSRKDVKNAGKRGGALAIGGLVS